MARDKQFSNTLISGISRPMRRQRGRPPNRRLDIGGNPGAVLTPYMSLNNLLLYFTICNIVKSTGHRLPCTMIEIRRWSRNYMNPCASAEQFNSLFRVSFYPCFTFHRLLNGDSSVTAESPLAAERAAQSLKNLLWCIYVLVWLWTSNPLVDNPTLY